MKCFLFQAAFFSFFAPFWQLARLENYIDISDFRYQIMTLEPASFQLYSCRICGVGGLSGGRTYLRQLAFPRDMHIPKKWLSSMSSEVGGVGVQNQHSSSFYTNDIFPNFKLSRYQMCSSSLHSRLLGSGGSTVIRLQKVTYISDKRRFSYQAKLVDVGRKPNIMNLYE